MKWIKSPNSPVWVRADQVCAVWLQSYANLDGTRDYLVRVNVPGEAVIFAEYNEADRARKTLNWLVEQCKEAQDGSTGDA